MVDGIIRDHDGNVAGFNKDAAKVSLAFEPFKSFKEFKPFRAFKEFAPFKAYFSFTNSRYPLDVLLRRGRN